MSNIFSIGNDDIPLRLDIEEGISDRVSTNYLVTLVKGKFPSNMKSLAGMIVNRSVNTKYLRRCSVLPNKDDTKRLVSVFHV